VSISSEFNEKRMAKRWHQIAALQVAQMFSVSTSPNFIQKCFVKWLFSFLSFAQKKPHINKLMKLMPGAYPEKKNPKRLLKKFHNIDY
jgi:hypothetical protein